SRPKKDRNIPQKADRNRAGAKTAMNRQYPPGTTIGVMGGGQLGRMFAIAARRMGYRVHIFTPDRDSPASQFADATTKADYHDEDAVQHFLRDLKDVWETRASDELIL